jgi:hypothetical protein
MDEFWKILLSYTTHEEFDVTELFSSLDSPLRARLEPDDINTEIERFKASFYKLKTGMSDLFADKLGMTCNVQ